MLRFVSPERAVSLCRRNRTNQVVFDAGAAPRRTLGNSRRIMIPFDDAHRAVHYPPDRRFRIWIRPSILAFLVAIMLIPLILAWIQRAIFGLPPIPPPSEIEATAPGPLGISSVGLLESFLQHALPLHADAERIVDLNGSSTALSERSLHPWNRVVAIDPAKGHAG